MANRRILLLGVFMITGLSLTGAALSSLQKECAVKNKAHPANYSAFAARPHAHYIQEHKRHAQSGLQSLFNYKLDQFLPWQAQGPHGQSSENL